MTEPAILAVDTASRALSVAVWAGGGIRFAVWQRRQRGHAEALLPLIERVLAAAAVPRRRLGAVAVTVGPGTFTGLRIGLAAARGLGLALAIPVVGLTTLEVMAFAAARRFPGRPVLVALDARRDQVYVQYFADAGGPYAAAWCAPAAAPAEAVAAMLVDGSVLAGSGAGLVAAHLSPARIASMTVLGDLEPDAADAARLASRRGPATRGAPPPRPHYLRAPDAVPYLGRTAP